MKDINLPIFQEETFAKCVRLVYEDGRDATVIIEDSLGMLVVMSEEYPTKSFSWPPPKDFEGHEFFEDFLASKSPQWITYQLLERGIVQIDIHKTRTLLEIAIPEMHQEIGLIMEDLRSPLGATTLLFMSEAQIRIEDYIGEPLMDWVYYEPTDHAIFLEEFVIPDVLRKITIPDDGDLDELTSLMLS